MPNERKIKKDELGYRNREKGRAKKEKLILDKNKKKTEYMFHYGMLQLYVKMVAKVSKIDRVKKFEYDYICRDYIQNNADK